MAAGLTDKLWGWEEVIALIDSKQEAPKRRSPTGRRRFEPMPFDLSQLHRLMVGHDESIQVGMIEDRVMKRIGWRLPYVYLHRKYCLKILKDHPDITPIELLRLPIAVMKGELILEQNRRALDACYTDPENKKWYLAVLKRAVSSDDHEIWVSSFYRLENRKHLKLRREGTIVREHAKN
ncbi:MAG: hypothetical protein WCF79_18110 [Rhodomicrobium sp.]